MNKFFLITGTVGSYRPLTSTGSLNAEVCRVVGSGDNGLSEAQYYGAEQQYCTHSLLPVALWSCHSAMSQLHGGSWWQKTSVESSHWHCGDLATWCSLLCLRTSYGLDDQGFESSQGLGIFLFTTVSTPALGPIQPPIRWVSGTLSLGIKRPGREADHSPLSSAEVKNAWSYTSTPQYAFMAWCSVKKSQEQLYLYL
jgi:hypothetical protein